MTDPPVAVVLRALGLGDTITGLPALRVLRDVLPEHRIVLATPRIWAPIVAAADGSIEVLDTAELAPLSGAPSEPELAVDLHGNGPASRDLLVPLRPRRLLAYADGRVRWRHQEHEVAKWCRLLHEGLPAPASACPPVGGILGAPPPSPGGRSRATVLHCGAAAPSRRWPADCFVAVAMVLAGEGHDVVITGGPGEEQLACGIAGAAGVGACVDLSVPDLLALVGRARLVVCGDTGVSHVATAYERPTVTLCGPTSPARWGPPGHPRHRVLWHGDDTGDPHGAAVDPALLKITVGEVIAAVHEAEQAGTSRP